MNDADRNDLVIALKTTNRTRQRPQRRVSGLARDCAVHRPLIRTKYSFQKAAPRTITRYTGESRHPVLIKPVFTSLNISDYLRLILYKNRCASPVLSCQIADVSVLPPLYQRTPELLPAIFCASYPVVLCIASRVGNIATGLE